MFDKPDTTTIRTLRIAGEARDPLVLQLDIQRALAQSRVAPASLPSTAILCIRRVRATIPRHGGQGELARAALQSALNELAQGAALPARGVVPARAEAVVFADRAELLACLARDWCAGDAAAHWWWHSLFRGSDISASVARAWLDTPEYAPAAFAWLATCGAAVPFVLALDVGAAQALLRALIERFALPALRPLLAPSLLLEQRAADLELVAMPAAPWLGWVPESAAAGSQLACQALLGVGLMLHRAPAMLRDHAFAAAVERWLRTDATATVPHAPRPPAAPELPAAAHLRTPIESPPHLQALSHPLPHAARPGGAAAAGDVALAPALRALSGATAPAMLLHATQPEPPEGIALSDQPAVAPQAATTPADWSIIETQIDTAFGGLFYLLNLALALELYGDFTMPAHAGMALPVWDFLALVGLELLGQPMRADPVWALLARMAGRALECPPGREFAPPEDWRISPAWLVPFHASAELCWSASADRLRVAHPAGFLLLDIARTDDARQLDAELRGYGLNITCVPRAIVSATCSPVALLAEPTLALERWLSCLMPYVRARLRRALGQLDNYEIARLVCAHQASVRISTARLDVFLSLADLPIAIRLAGLDRDPGWIPAAGRSVAFHFE